MNKSKKPSQNELNEIENLFKQNKFDELEKKILELIENYPNFFILFNILGVVLQKKGKLENSILNFQKTIELAPNFEQAHNNLGNVLQLLGKHEEAIRCYEKALQINPKYAEVYCNLSNALLELGKCDAAIKNCQKAIELKPDYVEAYNCMGLALSQLCKFNEAINNFEKVIKLYPNYSEAYSSMGNVLSELGRYEEAIKYHQKSLKLNPNYTKANFNESIIRLTMCDFKNGWDKYEYRFKETGIDSIRYAKNKMWDGSYLKGTLLVWAEQGIGDHIIFLSMVPDLKKCAENIVLEIDRRLVNLFSKYCKKINFNNINVIPLEKKLYNNFDKHIAIGSLGKYLRKSIESFKATPSYYLIPEKVNEKKYKENYLSKDKLNIGISWKTLNKKQQYRNINLEEMLPIFLNSKYNFINLQFGKSETDLKIMEKKHNIKIQTIPDIDNYHDIEKLAALINSLDLVITIQNSTTHLSGALGKKTLVMLSKNARWHWGINEKNSYWYPNVKIYKQETLGNWKSVIDSIILDLGK